MLPIIQFCWHKFTPRTLMSATVGEIYQLCQADPPDPFVFHDPTHRFSALILPALVRRLVEGLDLPLWESAAKIGLLDLIGQDQMHVHHQQVATLVAKVAVQCHKHVVLALDDAGRPLGLFVPAVAAERIGYVEPTLAAGPRVADLVASLMAVSSARREFHSEQFNQSAPDPYVCEGDAEDGSHLINYCPCIYHPSSVCGRQNVTST